MSDTLSLLLQTLPPFLQHFCDKALELYTDTYRFDENSIENWFFFIHYLIYLIENDERTLDNFYDQMNYQYDLYAGDNDAEGWVTYFDSRISTIRMSVDPNIVRLRRIAETYTTIYIQEVREQGGSSASAAAEPREGGKGAFLVDYDGYRRHELSFDQFGRGIWGYHHDVRDVEAVPTTNLNLTAALPFCYERNLPLVDLDQSVYRSAARLPPNVLQNISSYLHPLGFDDDYYGRSSRYIQSAYGASADYGPQAPLEVGGDDAEGYIYALDSRGVRQMPTRRGFRRNRVTRVSRDIYNILRR